MFRPEDIQARLRERPFRPLRIVLSEGRHFDVYHPDLVLAGVRDIHVGFPGPNRPTVYDSVTRVALGHIVSLEELPAAQQTGNGGT